CVSHNDWGYFDFW
nr:immunoglobulin heavy chain junction region [Macaca mulatta]MOW98416.1 immunoglobulin heavy chain junction region [Macaca mulatta]MOW98874.1 immunoglobulin heavy chain junction region [Macaca mulatta]MOW99575.1 immunoglobulin heavy chain junction region [Macaca mulatta]MOW99605.1 immunoglobulin heavy chain junction region [Macaca mulatta]